MLSLLKNRVVVAVLTALVAVGVTIVITDDPGPDGTHHRTVTIHVGTDSNRANGADATVKVPAAAVEQVQSSELGHHTDLRSETPDGMSSAQSLKLQEAEDAAAHNDQLPIVAPDAAPQQAGCRSQFISSYSSRRGVAPRLIVLHYTVSPNRVGWSDVESVVAFFARAATQASSNYVIDGEGHCAYIVRESDKAWAQAAANSFSISFEVINTGSEPLYIARPGLAKLASVVVAAAKRWHIPLQVGAVSGCVPTRAGIVTHQMLGLCGGGHHDIAPYSLSTVMAAVKSAGAASAPLGSGLQVRCRRIAWYRLNGRPAGTSTRRYKLRLAYVHRYHAACTRKGVAVRR